MNEESYEGREVLEEREIWREVLCRVRCILPDDAEDVEEEAKRIRQKIQERPIPRFEIDPTRPFILIMKPDREKPTPDKQPYFPMLV